MREPREGLTYDMADAVAHLCAADERLARVIDEAGPCTLAPDPLHDMFSYLVRSIIFQQLNGTAAHTIHTRFLDLWPEDVHPTPEQILVADADFLRTAGISGNKARALHDLADHMVRGALPTVTEALDLSDDELVRRLTDVRGIGPWTVHMLLMFRLGRPDVMPTGDYGVCAGFALTYGLDKHPTPTQLRAATEHWRPYRTVGSWYMWRAVDLPRERSATLR